MLATLVLAVVGQLVALVLRIPAIVVLLVLGMAAGGWLGWVDPDALFGTLLFPFVSLAVALILFVFTTLLTWSYYGERAITFIYDRTPGASVAGEKVLHLIWRLLWCVVIYVGASQDLELVWRLGDISNAAMALPNLLALALLSGVVFKLAKGEKDAGPTHELKKIKKAGYDGEAFDALPPGVGQSVPGVDDEIGRGYFFLLRRLAGDALKRIFLVFVQPHADAGDGRAGGDLRFRGVRGGLVEGAPRQRRAALGGDRLQGRRGRGDAECGPVRPVAGGNGGLPCRRAQRRPTDAARRRARCSRP